jgi:hypothetical protein
MSADAVKKFLVAIDLVFPAPQFDGDKTRQAAWQQLMATTLGGTDDHVLSETAATILRTRNPKKDGRFFPTPQECLEAVQEVAARLERERTPLLAAPKELSYETRNSIARTLMQAPMGRQAVKEGWGEAMFHFIVEHQRMPDASEAFECKRASREFKAEYEQLLKGDHPQSGPLARLAEGIIRKARERMGEKVA